MKIAVKITVLFFWVSSLCFAEGVSVLTHVSLDQATHQILSMDKNTVLGATTEIIDGKAIHIIKALDANGWIRFYKIDAETGILVS